MLAWPAGKLQYNCETLRKHFTKHLTQVAAHPSTYHKCKKLYEFYSYLHIYTSIAWLKFYLLFRLLHSVLIRVQVIEGECGPRLRPPGGVLLQGQMQQGRRFGVSMHFLQFRVRIKLQLSQYLSEKVTKTRCLDCFTSSKQFFQSLGSS